MRIIEGDLGDRRVVDLLHAHFTRAQTESPPGSFHALDLSGLRSADVTFWTIWDGQRLLGMGALKCLSALHGELKSMYVAQAARRKGAGRAMLRHVIATALSRGMTRLSLETGARAYFIPAQTLYRSHGFAECPPFADYGPDPNSVFMTLELKPTAGPD